MSAFAAGMLLMVLSARADDICADKQDWIEQRDGEAVRYDTEPQTTFWQRAFVWFVSLLPIEWLL